MCILDVINKTTLLCSRWRRQCWRGERETSGVITNTSIFINNCPPSNKTPLSTAGRASCCKEQRNTLPFRVVDLSVFKAKVNLKVNGKKIRWWHTPENPLGSPHRAWPFGVTWRHQPGSDEKDENLPASCVKRRFSKERGEGPYHQVWPSNNPLSPFFCWL